MNCLLIGGSYSVGKSEAIYRLANLLVSHGYTVIAGSIPSSFDDFRVVLEGLNKLGETIKIIINSPTDMVDIINQFKEFYDLNGGKYEVLISSIRDDNFWPRQDFFRIMRISSSKDFILEVPLAKITRRGINFTTALSWYSNQLDILINHIIGNSPYNLIYRVGETGLFPVSTSHTTVRAVRHTAVP